MVSKSRVYSITLGFLCNCFIVLGVNAPTVTLAEGRALYKLPKDKTFGYIFFMERKTESKRRYHGGTVIFQVIGERAEMVELRASDNIRQTGNPDSIRLSLPTRSRLLPRKVTLYKNGMNPGLDGKLPDMMGDPQDWFFPRVPEDMDDFHVHRRMFVRTARGLETLLGGISMGMKEENRGYWEWEFRPKSESDGTMQVRYSRSVNTADKHTTTFEGEGLIDFDKVDGVMAGRTFRATYTDAGRQTKIILRVQRIPTKQFIEMASPKPAEQPKEVASSSAVPNE